MDPTDLTSGVTATDVHLSLDDMITDLHLDPGSDSVGIDIRLLEVDSEPVSHRRRIGGVAQTDGHPDVHVLNSIHFDEVELPVEVQINEGSTSAPVEMDDARVHGTFNKRAVRLTEEEVVGVFSCVFRHRVDITFGDEQVDEPIVVDILKLRVPAGGRHGVVPADEPLLKAQAQLICGSRPRQPKVCNIAAAGAEWVYAWGAQVVLVYGC